jgi:GTP-binding protein Era
VVYVARDTHKSMVIGKGGAMLKKIGSAARAEIEELLEQKVRLELWVKVRQDWTEDPGFLRALGLGE